MDSLTVFPSAAQTPQRGRIEAEDAVGVTSVRRDHRRHVLCIDSDGNTLTLRDFCHATRRPGRSIVGIISSAHRRGGAAMRCLTDARGA
jgi:hypothetical protein